MKLQINTDEIKRIIKLRFGSICHFMLFHFYFINSRHQMQLKVLFWGIINTRRLSVYMPGLSCSVSPEDVKE